MNLIATDGCGLVSPFFPDFLYAPKRPSVPMGIGFRDFDYNIVWVLSYNSVSHSLDAFLNSSQEQYLGWEDQLQQIIV
jgi:hypothetical protein